MKRLRDGVEDPQERLLSELWPEGAPDSELVVEIYDHWLEPAGGRA